MSDLKINEIKETDEILRSFLNNALKEIMSVVKAECGSLFLFDSHNKELVLDSFYNSMNLSLRGLRQKIGEGIAGKVIDIKVPILVKDINTDSRFKRNGFTHYKTNSFISIPLYTSRGLLGIINLADKSSAECFSEKDLEVAATIARYVCLTIDSFTSCIGLKQEKETLDKQKSLLEKYASVGKLAAGVVHEINNPLDGVIRYANMVFEQIENNSIAREYLLDVKKGLNRIANITKSLLEFSHQVNFNSSHTKRYVDLHEVIDESLDVFNDKFNGRVRVEKKYKQDLPKVLDLGISHVVINLIKNALDAMPVGGTLEVSTDIKESRLEISFKDNGLGIPSEIKERIFEPFFSTKSIDKGTGLGLAICREIVSKYAGEILVESAPGCGSTFTVVIPRGHLKNA
ncbi:MAG: ATP-binding protein [Candidatus Omnitrophota bacterium]|nr:ATP-binding protein [Candidatus Omnitrophota bacterium]